MHRPQLGNDLQQTQPFGGGGAVSQPQAKSRPELRTGSGVPAISGGCHASPLGKDPWGPKLEPHRRRTDLELTKDTEWTWESGPSLGLS